MKKTIYLFIFVLMLPLVISNSVKINWDVEDLDLNYYDGFFIFYSYENNYIPPETANKKSCEKNPNCVFIDIIDTNQKSYYYILDNLKNERYVYFLYPSNKYNNFLSMPLYLGNSVHYQLPSINLPAKIYWKLSEESPIEDIDGFFIFLSEKKIYRPSIYTDKKTCLSSDFCIFVEKEEPFQTFFFYKVFAPFLSNYYLHIHPSIINSPLIGRPLIYNVYEEKTIENKIDKGYEIFFNQNELNFKIGLFYKELAYVQSKINEKNRNNKVIPNDLINRRNFLVDELKKLGLSETQIYDRGDLNLDYDLFWELKSSNYLDLYIYNMNFKIASIFQKLSLIQSIINRNETYNVKSEIRNFFYKQLDDLNINYFNKGEHKDLNYDQIWKLRSKEFYSQGFVIDDFQEEISDEIIYYDEFSLEPVSIDEKDYSDLIIEPKQELIWPINLEDNDLILTSCYGWRRLNPINNPNQITWHDGIDIRGNLIDVLAVADGIVYERCEGWPDSCGGRGNYITLYHYDLGTYSQYNHLHELFVEENQKINQGHVIGLMGQTGNVDGPHLDFKYYFDLPMSSRVFNPEGNPLCYLPVLPKENLDIIFKNHIEQKFDEYFADSAESCFWGRIKNKYLGGDNLAGITKCEFYNSIDYQIPFDYNKDKIIASEEPSETEDIFDDGGDIDQVVYNFAFENDIVPAKLFAILNVESSSQPFYSDGHPIVRFECRRYNSRVSGEEMVPCETTYNQPYGISAHTNYEAFKHALTLNRNQALLQTSFGLGQVMGFNYNLVGYSSVEEFYSSMFNENNQALAFLDFIKSNNQIFNELKNENTNWDIIAHFYAGPGYAQINHHVKLENAYNELLLT